MNRETWEFQEGSYPSAILSGPSVSWPRAKGPSPAGAAFKSPRTLRIYPNNRQIRSAEHPEHRPQNGEAGASCNSPTFVPDLRTKSIVNPVPKCYAQLVRKESNSVMSVALSVSSVRTRVFGARKIEAPLHANRAASAIGFVAMITSRGTDLCVCCSADTGVPTVRDVANRRHYVDGVGQFCKKCF
jgi:hypothetical protein